MPRNEAPCKMGKLVPFTRDEAAPFLLEWHYMTYVPKKANLRYYGYRDECGIACLIAFNPYPVNQYVTKRMFGPDWKEHLKVGELSRMACRDECPKLTESMFLSGILRMLRKMSVDALISYADMAEEHEGGIYRATNWTYTGLAAPNDKFFVDGCVLDYEGFTGWTRIPHQTGCTWPEGNAIEVNWRQCRHKFGASHAAGLRRVLGTRLVVKSGHGKHRFVKTLTRKAQRMFRRENIVT